MTIEYQVTACQILIQMLPVLPIVSLDILEQQRPKIILLDELDKMSQFLDVAVKVCRKLKEETARMVGAQVWDTSKDVRDVISISKLIRRDDGPQQIQTIMETMSKYGSPK